MRGRSGTITEHDGQMVVRGEDIISDQMMELPVDMVLLAVGLVPAARSEQLAADAGHPA